MSVQNHPRGPFRAESDQRSSQSGCPTAMHADNEDTSKTHPLAGPQQTHVWATVRTLILDEPYGNESTGQPSTQYPAGPAHVHPWSRARR